MLSLLGKFLPHAAYQKAMRLALLMLCLVTSAFAQSDARLGIPRSIREAMIGRWQFEGDEVHTIEHQGRAGLRTTYVASGQHFRSTAYFHPARGVVEIGCGPRTQHGQTCLVRPLEDGTLEVTRVSDSLHHQTVFVATRFHSISPTREQVH